VRTPAALHHRPSCSDAQIASFKARVYFALHIMTGLLWGGGSIAITAGLAAVAAMYTARRRRMGAQPVRLLDEGEYEDVGEGAGSAPGSGWMAASSFRSAGRAGPLRDRD
jgi:hypothetical protein